MPEGFPVALVTGGGRGVGAEVVRGLAARGYAVAIHCHASLREARAVASGIEAAGGHAFAVTANLREEGAVRAMVHRVLDHFGRLDVVAACAMLRRPAALETLSTADLLAHYEVNVIGTFIVVQEAVAAMRMQPEGGVILARATPDESQGDAIAFAASQAAIPGFIHALSAECAHQTPRIHAVSVALPPDQPPAEAASAMLARLDDVAGRG